MYILYNALGRRLDRVDFDALWPGFTRKPYALYSGDSACIDGEVVERPACFRGNTAVQYEGRYVAIWNLEGWDHDADTLAAGLVHEMFHVYQMEHGESRFPDDLAALDYPPDVENLAWKRQEGRLLAQALRAGNEQDCMRLLSQACGVRERRENRIGDQIQYEYQMETVEGMAAYVETLALEMINPEKYPARLEGLCQRLEDSRRLLDNRQQLYDTGTALLLTAR